MKTKEECLDVLTIRRWVMPPSWFNVWLYIVKCEAVVQWMATKDEEPPVLRLLIFLDAQRHGMRDHL